MNRALLAVIFVTLLTGVAQAQTPVLGDSAKGLLGPWEFSNAERTKICTASFRRDSVKVGFKVEFDANCAALFPLVQGIAGWRFPDNDNLFLLDAEGKPLIEFSEVETGLYEAPTPGVGVLFLQNTAANAPPLRVPDDLVGDWAIKKEGAVICSLTLSITPLRDGLALSVKPACDATIARLNFAHWQLDRGELVLTPARGTVWRFGEGEGGVWHRIPESPGSVTLTRQ
ncbi:MAG TPA: AprI/Inh family metalloprotease inhibitor [Pseudolabrys sp.]|nr:AprI/Inh family metalloprotease inhibitor [Pseudolabrys sp.]